MTGGIGPGAGAQIEIAPNTEIGRYRVENKLGQGGAGTVYKAFDSKNEEYVALKVLPFLSEKYWLSVSNEYKARKKIRNKEYVISGGEPERDEFAGQKVILYSIELAEGGSLRQRLTSFFQEKDPKKREEQILDCFLQLCRGIQDCHEAKIVHRDVKPENFLFHEGVWKITDFGVSLGGGGFLVRDGVGTGPYMAPEQYEAANPEDVDGRADIYSLGVILYEMLSGGKLPFAKGDLQEKKQRLKPKKLEGNEALWLIVNRCLEPDANERFSSAEELMREVQRLEHAGDLIVKIACRSCGHVNRNADFRNCEKCGKSIAPAFAPCTKCGRENRLDVEVCRGCGYNIGSERRLELRRQKLAEVLDSDLAEAIRILEEMLREGFKVGDPELKQVKELRGSLKNVVALMQDIETKRAAGDLPGMLGSWKKILAIVPRHALALDQVQWIEKILEAKSSLSRNVEGWIAEAKFDKGETALLKLLEEIPGDGLIKKKLKELRDVHERYSASYQKAQKEEADRRLNSARQALDECLAISPRSEGAIRLQKDILSKITGAQAAFASMLDGQLLEKAQFGRIQKMAQEIEKILVDDAKINKWVKSADESQTRYEDELKKAEDCEAARDLDKALGHLRKAERICPQSAALSEKIAELESALSQFKKKCKQLEPLLGKAAFAEALELLKKLEKQWPTNNSLAKTRLEIEQRQSRYKEAMESGERAGTEGDLESSARFFEAALSLCPESESALAQADKVQSDRQWVESSMKKIDGLLERGDHGKAESLIAKAAQLWPKFGAIEAERGKIARHREIFESLHGDYFVAKKDMALLRARELNKKLLKLSPEAEAILQEKEGLDALLKETAGLASSVGLLLACADFAGARKKHKKILDLQADFPQSDSLGKAIGATEERYAKLVARVEASLPEGDLDQAEKTLAEARAVCPQSAQVETISKRIDDQKREHARELSQFKAKLAKADFAAATLHLKHMDALWKGHGEFQRKKHKDVKESYGDAITRAKTALAEKKANEASRYCELAGELCPDSSEISLLRGEIELMASRQDIKHKILAVIFIISLVVIFLVMAYMYSLYSERKESSERLGKFESKFVALKTASYSRANNEEFLELSRELENAAEKKPLFRTLQNQVARHYQEVFQPEFNKQVALRNYQERYLALLKGDNLQVREDADRLLEQVNRETDQAFDEIKRSIADLVKTKIPQLYLQAKMLKYESRFAGIKSLWIKPDAKRLAGELILELKKEKGADFTKILLQVDEYRRITLPAMERKHRLDGYENWFKNRNRAGSLLNVRDTLIKLSKEMAKETHRDFAALKKTVRHHAYVVLPKLIQEERDRQKKARYERLQSDVVDMTQEKEYKKALELSLELSARLRRESFNGVMTLRRQVIAYREQVLLPLKIKKERTIWGRIKKLVGGD